MYNSFDEKEWLISCIGEATAILAMIPEDQVIDRASMEGHIQKLQEELDSIQES